MLDLKTFKKDAGLTLSTLSNVRAQPHHHYTLEHFLHFLKDL